MAKPKFDTVSAPLSEMPARGIPGGPVVEAFPEPVYIPTPNAEAKDYTGDSTDGPLPETPQKLVVKAPEEVKPGEEGRSEVVRAHDISHAEFLEQLIAQRNEPPPEPPPPPEPTEKMKANTALEMEAGRARVAHFEAQKRAAAPQEPPTERDGVVTPVPRDGGYQHEKGNPQKGHTTGAL